MNDMPDEHLIGISINRLLIELRHRERKAKENCFNCDGLGECFEQAAAAIEYLLHEKRLREAPPDQGGE